MAVDLANYVASLKREVQPPGTEIFAGVGSSMWVGYLADAFWEARLDGFLEGYAADDQGVVTPTLGQDDIGRREIALVILYAGIKVLRNRILNMKTSFRAKAGPVEYEEQSSAQMLTEMLKQLRITKSNILDELDRDETCVVVLDAYSTRVHSTLSYYGGTELMG